MAAQNGKIEWPSHFSVTEGPVQGLFSGTNQMLKFTLNVDQNGEIQWPSHFEFQNALFMGITVVPTKF